MTETVRSAEHGSTIPGLVKAAAEQFGAHEALVDGDVRMTFAALHDAVRDVARALIATGVRRGDRVCVWSPNTHHWVVAALAAHSAGAALVPLNTRYTGAEAIDILGRSRVRVLFLPDTFLGRDYLASLREAEATGAGGEPAEAGGGIPVPALPDLELVVRIPVEHERPSEPGVVAWSELVERAASTTAQEADARAAEVLPDDVADILFTSGTTGRPKGAMSSHRQAVEAAVAWAEPTEVSPADRYMIIAPFFHSFGYKAGLLVGLLRGATIVPQITFDVDAALDAIERERITILPGPPTIFETLLAHPGRAGRDLSSLRLAVAGSAMVPVALVERMRRELTFQTVLTGYGLTEAVVVTMCRADDDPQTVSGSSGCATAGFELRIAGADGSALPPGEQGEIWFRGPNVMLGYLDDERATREAIDADGWFHSGDVGRLDVRGYLTITDRIKDMLTVGGFNVYPAEVENVLARLDGVIAAAVIGVPDERMGEVPAAYLVAQEDHALDEGAVVAFCRRQLANFKVPRTVTFVEALPRNAAGKVLKSELRAQLAGTE
ncbi:FadD3 family acyl-CoA ligase [Conexibacter woesei]|uniref:AMP-dependent synthetase and ligase n=1 Tax=Conexibacter woesei (strain DSM 14684 / CCUG 47730 / CIP 108061 / JCM 11494 / NBRC 100937 / ID131577) TaxID=469383 RepID=D3F6L7_CONWI|nr:FadD3 family acyl-CoA ligase [Conexibacter woesei]ADB50784.1 AMP-dependent synthetase and ligase [Conexibacter woesei DSM 14684]